MTNAYLPSEYLCHMPHELEICCQQARMVSESITSLILCLVQRAVAHGLTL